MLVPDVGLPYFVILIRQSSSVLEAVQVLEHVYNIHMYVISVLWPLLGYLGLRDFAKSDMFLDQPYP